MESIKNQKEHMWKWSEKELQLDIFAFKMLDQLFVCVCVCVCVCVHACVCVCVCVIHYTVPVNKFLLWQKSFFPRKACCPRVALRSLIRYFLTSVLLIHNFAAVVVVAVGVVVAAGVVVSSFRMCSRLKLTRPQLFVSTERLDAESTTLETKERCDKD